VPRGSLFNENCSIDQWMIEPNRRFGISNGRSKNTRQRFSGNSTNDAALRLRRGLG